MGQIRRIVIGVDGSAGSSLAVRWVADTAAMLAATVIAVHAFEAPRLAVGLRVSSVPPEVLAGAVEEARASAEEELAGAWVQAIRDGGVPVETVCVEGHPAEVLLELTEERDGDLIVLGRRGHSEMHHLLLGSISHHVVNHASVPVVIVPPGSAPAS